jgi:hypothetical protein
MLNATKTLRHKDINSTYKPTFKPTRKFLSAAGKNSFPIANPEYKLSRILFTCINTFEGTRALKNVNS